MRAGRYADAVSARDAALQQMKPDDPGREDLENRRALYASLADVPPQTITFERGDRTLQLARNALGTWNVHVDARAHGVDWIFDTGASLSTIVQSEADALGLQVRESPAFIRGSTGAKNNLRLAVAPELRVGAARLTNVIFLVLPDQALYIEPVRYQIRGILGMPVLYALGKFSLDGDGTVRINAERSAGTPNFVFDGWSPIINAMHNNRRLRLLLDTGANVTTLYPSARKTLTDAELASLTEKKEQSGGAGETISRTTDVVPTLSLKIGGTAIDLHNVTLLRSAPPGDERDGVLGMDVLRAGFTVDFAAGVLTLGGK
jgi:predicted aspartyl protease